MKSYRQLPTVMHLISKPDFRVANHMVCFQDACSLSFGLQIFKNSVRVKGGMSLRNAMWHDLRHGIIYAKYDTCGMTLKNKLIEERTLFSRQFYKSASFLMLRTLAEYLKTTRQQIED